MNDSVNSFAQLASINVNDRVERKGQLSYLSWAWAVDQLLRIDPAASWEYRWADGVPFVRIGETAMVFCTVTAFGKARCAQLPVMDNRNRPIPNPDAFAVNTAMQRALVKAIALHGLGLYIYAGEDLPAGQEPEKPAPLVQDVALLRESTTLEEFRANWRTIPDERRPSLKEVVQEMKAKLAPAPAPETAAA